jgi:uncharacterized protein (TIGR03435 family)
MNVRGRPIGRLVEGLRGRLDRIVIDETGLSGNFDIDLKWGFSDDRAQRNAWILTALKSSSA